MDRLRRNLLGGAIVTGAVMGMTRGAGAQTSAALRPPEMAVPPQLPAVPSQTGLPEKGVAEAGPTDIALRATLPPPAIRPGAGALDWANLRRYRKSNDQVKAWPSAERQVVLMGDSITDNWPAMSGDFFEAHSLVGRGISGQTTAQMVVRFWSEVVDLKPRVVHIMAGTNDIAENLDPYDMAQTTRNLAAMAAMAASQRIKVIMASVPPATSFSWRLERGNPNTLILALNDWISKHCQARGYTYADYWPVLAAPDGSLQSPLGVDSVHPNAAGYTAMAPVLLDAVARTIRKV